MKNKLTILLAFICTACFPVDVIGQHEAVDIAKKSEIEAMGNQYMLLGRFFHFIFCRPTSKITGLPAINQNVLQ